MWNAIQPKLHRRTLLGIAAVVVAAAVALATPLPPQQPDTSPPAERHPTITEPLSQLESALAAQIARRHAHHTAPEALQDRQILQLDTESSGWLGVTIVEVTAEKARELRLPAEHGVLVTSVEKDSPAERAGLRANDVITEYNSQRVEGTVQFRRMIRETPAGRTVQLTLWRDGRSQTVAVELGSWQDQFRQQFRVLEPNLEFWVPPRMEIFGGFVFGTPTLGIVGEDLSGQLAEYFGVPDGEGVLVREVRSGTPAEKAGLKAGDVILRVNGERVRTLAELREKLRSRREEKTVRLDVWRRGQSLSLNVEIEPPPARGRTRPGRRVVL
ncbi:MAG: PDZ domain-containing protein [Firmicutes bacterium]|nr:PDZ domain-containing protein [Bacillota bacterium]